MIISLDRRKCCDEQKFQVILKNSSQHWDRKLFKINCHLKTNNIPGRMRQFLWPFRSSKCITVEPQSVNDHPKCEYLLVGYGRWSLTRIEPQGASSEKMSRGSMLLACVAWRFCWAGRRSGVAAKFAREARENAAPISSRFLCPRPTLLLSAPNQNRHATQASMLSTIRIQDRCGFRIQ